MADMEMSLAALAGLDVSEVAEIRYEVIAQGAYGFDITNAAMVEGTNSDNEVRFCAEIEFTINEVKALIDTRDSFGKPIDKESLIGRKHTEKLFITPSKPEKEVFESIGRIRTMVNDCGGEWGANMVDNVANLKGLSVAGGQIKHRTDKEDKDRKYARLVLPPKK